MIDLDGKIALITGGSRGIGRACAIRLAEAGANVVINYVSSRSAAEDVAREVMALGREAVVIKADVGEPDDVEVMMDFVRDTFGKIDVLISNAATGGFRPLTATMPKHFDAAMRINVHALIFLVQSALPLLERSEERSKVIALSSHGSHRALPAYGLIGSTKAALESMIRHFALELGGRGINFNTVQAGLVETDSFLQMPHREKILEIKRARSLTGNRYLAAEDVADAVAFLASPLSDLVQGATIVVDAGANILA